MDFYLDNLLNLSHITVLSYQQQEQFINEEYIYEKVKELTVEQVSVTEQLSLGQSSKYLLQTGSKKKIGQKDWSMPEKLSLDEFSQKKGNRKFATVVCAFEKNSLLEVIDSHLL